MRVLITDIADNKTPGGRSRGINWYISAKWCTSSPTTTTWWYSKFIAIWWRHQMEAFTALLAICAGNSPVPGEFPTQRPVTRSFDVFFDLRVNKRLSKQLWSWWFETHSPPLWRHSNVAMWIEKFFNGDKQHLTQKYVTGYWKCPWVLYSWTNMY